MELHELRNKLCNELKEYGEMNLTVSTLDIIDKLSHTVKNLDKIIGKAESKSDESVEEDDAIHKMYALMDETDDLSLRMDIQKIISKMHG